MRSILITGGAGFIGANLVNYLTQKYPDDRIVVLDMLTYAGTTEHLPKDMLDGRNPRLRFWYGNVCNAALVDTLVEGADIVIHMAAETHVTRSIYDSLLFFQTDVLGTQTIANAVVKAGGKVKRLIHVSSSEVYGTASEQTMTEEHPLNPMNPYAGAKCGADRLIYSYWATYRIPAVIIRPFNNFGPMQHLEKVIPRFITGVLLGEKLTIHGTGEAARDFLYVDDTCRAIDLVMQASDNLVHGETSRRAARSRRPARSAISPPAPIPSSCSTPRLMPAWTSRTRPSAWPACTRSTPAGSCCDRVWRYRHMRRWRQRHPSMPAGQPTVRRPWGVAAAGRLSRFPGRSEGE
jgi:dTDP-glucose 4,6-dehydratase